MSATEKPVPVGNPCVPSPCGPNSQCRVIGNTPACSCLQNYIGRAPNCRPECTINSECPSNRACQNERCVDPCPGSCGAFADCVVITHRSLLNLSKNKEIPVTLHHVELTLFVKNETMSALAFVYRNISGILILVVVQNA
ncbi:hypothetical protein BDFB_000145 [Asbolus verrucosus]|uniref:EGF-like domain-containing protein n=1 Tax=Asbolus verrucosus TaxID=1661398 RepID=A0A482VVQ4_ASBVE|nr:hypothetical protein BDFB_000145 [Asbolus verrucosus]